MGVQARVLASVTITTMLAPVLLAASACSPSPAICAGQCRPPFQLDVAFRPGTSEQAALAAMRACQANPVVIRIGQPHRISTSAAQWTAVIYTNKIGRTATHGLLTCLHRSPAIRAAAWPD